MYNLAKFNKKYGSHGNKHIKHVTTYKLSLLCYAAEIRKLDPIVLDSNILAYITILIKLLTNIVQNKRFQNPWNDENDFNDRNVSFIIGCNYCEKSYTSAFAFMVHIMDTNQHNFANEPNEKLQTVRDMLMTNYNTFLNEEREILQRNGFDRPVLEKMLNFYFITQLFLRLTTRYSNALRLLMCQSSTVVVRGVLDLLKELGDLMTRAKCVESKPNIDKIVTHEGHRLFYKIDDKTFSSSASALEYAETRVDSEKGNSSHLPGNQNSTTPQRVSKNTESLQNVPPLEMTIQPNQSTNQKRAPTPPNSGTLPKFNSNSFRPEMEDLIEIGNVLKQFQISSTIPSELECALKGIVNDVTVTCFGAKVSGVGYEADDINLYVDDGEKVKTDDSVKLLLQGLIDFLQSNACDWLIHNVREDGVRSHLTVKNICENVICRISFASEVYCSNTRLIQYYMETFPICQYMTFYVQEFSKSMGIDLPRYVCIVLVLFWMQMRDELPSVERLQADLEEEQWSGSWLVNFNPKSRTDLKLKDCETDLRKYANDFFLFYGRKFSFEESIVCPYNGMVINRKDFSVENEWRLPQKHYKAHLETSRGDGSDPPRFDNTRPMCVQDLLELTTNIAASITPEDTCKFVRVCNMACEYYANQG